MAKNGGPNEKRDQKKRQQLQLAVVEVLAAGTWIVRVLGGNKLEGTNRDGSRGIGEKGKREVRRPQEG